MLNTQKGPKRPAAREVKDLIIYIPFLLFIQSIIIHFEQGTSNKYLVSFYLQLPILKIYYDEKFAHHANSDHCIFTLLGELC
jgi:hypothetical protein